MYCIRALRARCLRNLIAAGRRAHEAPLDDAGRHAHQLNRFNELWPQIRKSVPFYADLASQNRLPDRFSCWQDVIAAMPVVDRNLIKREGARLFSTAAPPQWHRITGGSTAQPLQLPSWVSEKRISTQDQWLGRAWYDIRPDDRVFLLWGHRHLLGRGFKGRLRSIERQIRDRMMGYCRFSAYDLSPENLRRGGDEILRFRPAYLLGYSVALDMLARANTDRRQEFAALRLKAVIGTAEGFPATDSAQLISDTFGAPTGMEYGAVETAVLAHTTPVGGYEVFWNSNFLEAQETGGNGGKVVRVTSLYPRCFPLIRYELGDEIELAPGDNGMGVLRFSRVLGRCNAYLELPDGTKIHSEAITHCVSSFGEIRSYQAVQTGHEIALLYTAAAELSPDAAQTVHIRLARIHPLLAHVRLERVDRLRQSVAGKTPMIIRT